MLGLVDSVGINSLYIEEALFERKPKAK